MAHVVHHGQTSHWRSVTHPAQGLMRRHVDVPRVRILYLSVAGPGGLVESRPELRTELSMDAPGCSWNPVGNKAVIRSWRIPLRTPLLPCNSFEISGLREQRHQSVPVSFTIRTRTRLDSARPPEPFLEARTRHHQPRTLRLRLAMTASATKLQSTTCGFLSSVRACKHNS